MRTAASLATALVIGALTCAPAAAQRADSALVGSWSGEAPITDAWTAQRSLSIRLDIKEDGSATGTIGDAQLFDARVTADLAVARAMRLARRYAIDGKLRGPLIRAERIERDRVHLSVDRAGETLTGDLMTSGSYTGGPADLVLTAKGIVLRRVARTAATTHSGRIAIRPTTPR